MNFLIYQHNEHKETEMKETMKKVADGVWMTLQVAALVVMYPVLAVLYVLTPGYEPEEEADRDCRA